MLLKIRRSVFFLILFLPVVCIYSQDKDFFSAFLHRQKVLYTLPEGEILQTRYFSPTSYHSNIIKVDESGNYLLPVLRGGELYLKTPQKEYGPYPDSKSVRLHAASPEYWMISYCKKETEKKGSSPEATGKESQKEECYAEIKSASGIKIYGPYARLVPKMSMAKNGKRWLFEAYMESQVYLISDQGKRGPYRYAGEFEVSRDGAKWYAVVYRDDAFYLISSDGREYGPYADVYYEGGPRLHIPPEGPEWVLRYRNYMDDLKNEEATDTCDAISGDRVKNCYYTHNRGNFRTQWRRDYYLVSPSGREYGPYGYIRDVLSGPGTVRTVLYQTKEKIYVARPDRVYGPYKVSYYLSHLYPLGDQSWALVVQQENGDGEDLVVDGRVYMKDIFGVYSKTDRILQWYSLDGQQVLYHQLEKPLR